MDTEYMITTGVHVTRSLSDSGSSHGGSEEDDMAIRKGPWAEDEDSVLLNYVAVHGEGHWNSVARCSGLKRTGKSCRLRWLNYLRPNVRRGNITLQEQLLILDLHSRWGNRWSKIAEQLPGRTDNEIKNYWRTRVVKQARQLKCDVNSKQFRDTLRFVWIPQLMERIQIQSSTCGTEAPSSNGNGHQTSSCNTNKAHSETCGTESKPLMLSEVSSYVQFQPHFLSESNVSHNNNLMGGSTSNWSSDHGVEMDIQAFETDSGFGGPELWTDENIWFLQQHLADDL